MSTNISESGEEKKGISWISIEAALSRANALRLIIYLQDAISRIGAVLIFIASFGIEDLLLSTLPLLLLGALWMISRSTLNGMVTRIERNFIARALQSENTDDSTKWEYLLIMLGTHQSATPFRVTISRVLAYEPLLLTSALAALTYLR